MSLSRFSPGPEYGNNIFSYSFLNASKNTLKEQYSEIELAERHLVSYLLLSMLGAV